MNIRYGKLLPTLNAIKWFIIVLMMELVVVLVVYLYIKYYNETNYYRYKINLDINLKLLFYICLFLPILFAIKKFKREYPKYNMSKSCSIYIPSVDILSKIALSISILWMIFAGLFLFIYDPFDGSWGKVEWKRAFFVILAPVGGVGLATAMYRWIRND